MHNNKQFLILGFVVLFIGLSTCSFAQVTEQIDEQAETYFYRCAGCHTIGKGKLTGPDLIDSTKWSEADLGAAIKKMEKNVGPMSVKDIQELVQFLKDIKVNERIDQQRQKMEAKMRSELPEPSFEKGQQLYRGIKPLANGGPSCISCHYFVNEGGSLGLDLTNLNQKASGIVLQSSIEKAAYKVMRPIYEKHPITPEEALHLAEYLSKPEKATRRFVPTIGLVHGISCAGFAAFIIWLWRMNKKRKGPTREKLVQKYKSH